MAYGHLVLRQRAGLVAADNRGAAERLDSLEVLHETVLAGHPLGGERQTDCDRGDETLGHVRDDNPDEKDHRVYPVVAHRYRHSEEGHTEENRPARYVTHESVYFPREGRRSRRQSRRQLRDSSHYRLIAACDDYALSSSCAVRDSGQKQKKKRFNVLRKETGLYPGFRRRRQEIEGSLPQERGALCYAARNIIFSSVMRNSQEL